eukprot:6439008-Alexandrium_andersonii.AAC.1
MSISMSTKDLLRVVVIILGVCQVQVALLQDVPHRCLCPCRTLQHGPPLERKRHAEQPKPR